MCPMESPRPPPVLSRLGERLPLPPIRADNQAPGRQSGPWVSDPQPGGPLLSASPLLLVGCVPRSRMRSSRPHSCQRHGAPLPGPPKVATGAETGRAAADRAADTPGLEGTPSLVSMGRFLGFRHWATDRSRSLQNPGRQALLKAHCREGTKAQRS